MSLMSGPTKFTVREAIQPRETEQILASTRLLSGTTYSDVFDTQRFKEAVLYTNISQFSGTVNATLDITMQASPYNDGNWFDVVSATQRNSAGKYYEKLSGYLGNYTRFKIDSLASSNGGIWTQIDVNFIR